MENTWKDYIKENLTYDPDTGEVRWSKEGGRNRRTDRAAGSDDGQGYLIIVGQIDKQRKKLRLHSVAWFLHYGEWPAMIDHINGNRSDNRIVNLRLSTKQQNTQNAKLRRDSKSGLKGVMKRGKYNRWRASIRMDGKKTSLGEFTCPTAAALAYNKAAKELFGEFARLNFLTR